MSTQTVGVKAEIAIESNALILVMQQNLVTDSVTSNGTHKNRNNAAFCGASAGSIAHSFAENP